MPNKIDRNANSLPRLRRNMQRLSQGALTSTVASTIKAVYPITGGGPIKANPSIGIAQSGSTTNGYLSSTDWNRFNAGGSTSGNYVLASTQLSTTAPLAGGGYLSTGLTISMPQATSTANGWLSSTDWNNFYSKLAGSTVISTTAPIQGGGALSTGITISETQAGSTTNGWLSSTDWNTFYRIFGASGSTHQFGNVPDPGSTAGSTRFLREDATWATPAGGGGGSPSGPDGSVQFASTGAFAGNGNFFTDGAGNITTNGTWSGVNGNFTGGLQVSGFSGLTVQFGGITVNFGSLSMNSSPFFGPANIYLYTNNIYMNSGGGTGGGNLYMDGGIVEFGSNPGGTPSNTTTPVGWLQVTVGGTTSYIPYYR